MSNHVPRNVECVVSSATIRVTHAEITMCDEPEKNVDPSDVTLE